MIDLHTHSTCSDGTLTPKELVLAAGRAGITHLSLTDHDTFEGVSSAREEALRQGICFMAGLEISAEFQPGTMHILGYGFREEDFALCSKMEYVQRCRRERNPKIIQRLNDMGMAITLDEAAAEAGGKLVGRPHFARVLLRKGYVRDLQEAFDRYLAKGQPAYVDKVRLSPEESVACIRNAGGVAVLAHPLQLKAKDDGALEGILRGLVGLGLQGMECHYRNHSAEDTRKFLDLAGRHGLIVTGGSDFHGRNRPDIQLGKGEGDLDVPLACWDALAAAARSH